MRRYRAEYDTYVTYQCSYYTSYRGLETGSALLSIVPNEKKTFNMNKGYAIDKCNYIMLAVCIYLEVILNYRLANLL